MRYFAGKTGMTGKRRKNPVDADFMGIEDIVTWNPETGFPQLSLLFWTSQVNAEESLTNEEFEPEKSRIVDIPSGTRRDGLDDLIDKFVAMKSCVLTTGEELDLGSLEEKTITAKK